MRPGASPRRTIEVHEFGLVDRFDVFVGELEFIAREHHLLYGGLDGGSAERQYEYQKLNVDYTLTIEWEIKAEREKGRTRLDGDVPCAGKICP